MNYGKKKREHKVEKVGRWKQKKITNFFYENFYTYSQSDLINYIKKWKDKQHDLKEEKKEKDEGEEKKRTS